LNNPDGTFAGVVFGSFDPEYLSGFFSDLAIGKNSSFAVIGRDMIIRDMIRGSGRATELIGRSVPNPHLLSALAQVADGDYEAVSSLDGVARIYSYRTLQNYPLVVLASTAEPEIFATYNERKTWIIVAAAALSLIFVCVAGYQLPRLAEGKRNEVALKNSRENLARAQRIAGIGSFDHDLATNKAEWSDELYRLYGLTPGEAGGDIKIALPFVHPEDRDKFLSIKDQAEKRLPSACVDFRIVRRDGVERILHRQSDLIFDESGVPVRIAGTLQDITERKKTELEINRSRENLARAQQIAAIGSFEHDRLTGEADWSDEMYRILGLEKTEAVPGPETLLKLIHPDDCDRFDTYRSRELEGKSMMPFEYRVVRPDGVERIVRRESAGVFDEEGRLLRRYGTLQDVTELRVAERRERELERQLLHSQKLEALGTLAGGIAHDLNNTLTPIMALSKVAARQLEPGDALRANLETIFTASEQARDLVKRVLAFSRRDKVDKKPTSLSSVVMDVLKLLRATIPSSIQVEPRIGDVPAILADASQIQQVVTNLVMNAIQAIGSGTGVITVILERASPLASGEVVRLSVIDNGKGMDEATRLRIFEPFFTTKEVGQGTGLGLSIIERIVTDHGGRIEVESELGRGTRFDVFLPLPEARGSVAA
jgi:PAS domain S-box-containing protein